MPTACNFFKKRLQCRFLAVNFAKILRMSFLQNVSGRLLLNFHYYRKLTQIKPNLGGCGRGDFYSSPCSFSLNISEIVKAINLAFSSISNISCRQIITSSTFFQFTADSEQCRSWIMGAWSVVLTLSLKATFYLTKTENSTKKSPTQPSYYCFE